MCSQYSHEFLPHTRKMCFLDGQCWCRIKASWYSDQFSISVSLLQGLLQSLKSAETPAGPGFYSTWIKLKDILAPREDIDGLTSCYWGDKDKDSTSEEELGRKKPNNPMWRQYLSHILHLITQKLVTNLALTASLVCPTMHVLLALLSWAPM